MILMDASRVAKQNEYLDALDACIYDAFMSKA